MHTSSNSPPRDLPRVLTGPVVGRVTSNSARVLLETAGATTIDAVATDGIRKPIELRSRLSARQPQVIRFEGLQPETTYAVTFSGVRSDIRACFRTLPESPERLRVACVSCNDPSTGNPALPAWSRLLDKVERDEVDIVLHLGDQVYADPAFEKGLFYLRRGGTEEQIREVFRETYRRTWSAPPVAAVLARTSNLMIWDDHDVRDNWSAVRKNGATAPERRVLDIAHEIYREYQAILSSTAPSLTADGTAMHAHTFGTTGLILLDERGGREPPESSANPLLGQTQWAALERLLGEPGPMTGVRHLIVAGPLPIAFLTGRATSLLARFIPDLRDQWSHADFSAERRRLLDRLRGWCLAVPGRDVILAAGDAHVGLISEIRHTDGTVFRQLVASPVSSPPHPRALRWLLERISSGDVSLGGGYTFRHFEWTSELNFGLIETGRELSTQLIKAGV